MRADYIAFNRSSQESRLKMADDSASSSTDGQKKIEIFVEGTDSAHREAFTSASNVAALKTEMSLSGTISVNSVLANDNTLINEGDKVTVVGGNKTGGSQ